MQFYTRQSSQHRHLHIFCMSRKNKKNRSWTDSTLCTRQKLCLFERIWRRRELPVQPGTLRMSTFFKRFHLFTKIGASVNSIDSGQMLHGHHQTSRKNNEEWSHAGSSQFCPLSNDLGPDQSDVSCVTWVQTVCLCQVPTSEGQHKSKWKRIHVDASYASSLTTW